MPGPVAPQSQADSPRGHIPIEAGHSHSVIDRTCAALAKSADLIDQHAKHVAEQGEKLQIRIAKNQAIIDGLVARDVAGKSSRG